MVLRGGNLEQGSTFFFHFPFLWGDGLEFFVAAVRSALFRTSSCYCLPCFSSFSLWSSSMC